ncbi:hypothetical protein [Sphingobacterium sp. SGR-19]|uniref:hypothetical protein n=1 Tax=Sphingobacterium sp. SGR-19 TaxID=2710886 RepID=UPI0013ECA8FF|nr:hypothetical protein [Sphingobacterium sp. SGR-19]NGM66820.1 hypothetical protein [Sphingobacterium sp. SGR-19]
MTKKIIIAMVLFAVSVCYVQPVLAQRGEGNKKYWEKRREAEKKRNEYYRERDKKREEYARERYKKAGEYHRERDKKEAEYYREAAKRDREYRKERRKHSLPRWARSHRYDARHHVYFRDYRTFYDPYRGGYVYLDGRNWTFSSGIPSFLINVDLGRANIRVVRDIPIERHPEDFYDDYDEDYWDD